MAVVAALYNDFGPSSIDGWLTDLAAREMLNHALLDPGRRQLILDGTRANLTKLEFDVLQYLHEREGRVVSRATLLRDVWGYDWSGGSNVVEVVISALRRKLGDSAGSLQTVRGAGYRFTARPDPGHAPEVTRGLEPADTPLRNGQRPRRPSCPACSVTYFGVTDFGRRDAACSASGFRIRWLRGAAGRCRAQG
jgi:DNA-binding winged helix-turn-helix (wHTH) protein